MPTWLDVTTIVIVIGVTAFAVIVGVRRRQPTWAVVVTAAGVAVFLTAIRWAIEIGDGADVAVFLGALGFGAWVFATERTRRAIDTKDRRD
jgi:uncharacterized membrane protein YjjB (DUF3815 family)